MESAQDPLVLVLARLDSIDSRLGALEQRMGGLEQRMGGLEQRMGGLEQRMDGLERRMEQGYQDLDRGLVSLHTDLTDFRSETEANFEGVRKDVRWLTEKWVEHDKEIFRLKTGKLMSS